MQDFGLRSASQPVFGTSETGVVPRDLGVVFSGHSDPVSFSSAGGPGREHVGCFEVWGFTNPLNVYIIRRYVIHTALPVLHGVVIHTWILQKPETAGVGIGPKGVIDLTLFGSMYTNVLLFSSSRMYLFFCVFC